MLRALHGSAPLHTRLSLLYDQAPGLHCTAARAPSMATMLRFTCRSRNAYFTTVFTAFLYTGTSPCGGLPAVSTQVTASTPGLCLLLACPAAFPASHSCLVLWDVIGAFFAAFRSVL